LMISPLPRNKRAKNPRAEEDQKQEAAPTEKAKPAGETVHVKKPKTEATASLPPTETFNNNPFAKLDVNPRQES